MARRERTRHLIELGGLVTKAGLVDLFDDDRATLYGALLEVAKVARSDDGTKAQIIWKRHGHRTFEAEAATDDTPVASTQGAER